jgi:hypothetical protein
LTFSADGLPDGLYVDPDSGIISGYVAEDALQTTPYSITVSVDNGNGGSDSQTFNWFVNDSAMNMYSESIVASAGVDTGAVTVATFADSDANWEGTDFTATINWGDGASYQGAISGSLGSFTVAGDHTYDSPGIYTFQISVTDGYTTVTATGTATVNDSTIAVSGGVEEGVVVDTTATGTWASFSDSNLTTISGDYTATINWGDGSSSTGAVTGSDGEFIISGSHIYANDGTDTVTITLADQGGSTFTTARTVYSTAQVGDMYAGESATITLASFTVADSTEPASAYTAIVNWGDGSATSAATVSGSGGVFTVVGSHLYGTDSLDQTSGYYTATVTLTGPNEVTLNSSGDESALTATKNIIVTRPELTGSGETLTATDSVGFNSVEVASFTDPDLTDGTSEFTATINWRDGTTSDGTIFGLNGQFQVLGSHTFAASESYAVETIVAQDWNYSVVCMVLSATELVVAQGSPQTQQPSKHQSNVPFVPSKDYIQVVRNETIMKAKELGLGEQATIDAFNNGIAEAGFEIGTALTHLAEDLDRGFKTLTTDQKNQIRESMYAISSGLNAWDIAEMYNTETSPFFATTKEQAQTIFKQFVTVDGNTYFAGVVNYFLWGRINRLLFEDEINQNQAAFAKYAEQLASFDQLKQQYGYSLAANGDKVVTTPNGPIAEPQAPTTKITLHVAIQYVVVYRTYGPYIAPLVGVKRSKYSPGIAERLAWTQAGWFNDFKYAAPFKLNSIVKPSSQKLTKNLTVNLGRDNNGKTVYTIKIIP